MPTQAEKRRLQAEIEEARQRNALYRVAGTLRLQTQYHYRDARAPSKRWRRLPGFRNISVCSGAKKWKALSPLYLGPLRLADGTEIGSLEHAWTYSQVFREDLAQDGAVSADWLRRRAQGFALPRGTAQGKRVRPRGKPEFWLWQGERLGELAARKRIYCELYAQHVVQLDAYRELKLLLKEGYNVQLFGYDCYDLAEQGRSLVECLEDLDAKFGHEFVLYGLLQNERFWE